MRELLLILKISACVFSIVWIWFRTNAFYEYFFWLPFKFIKAYKAHLQRESLNLTSFLEIYHSNFFIKLITCPVCTIAWLSILAGCLINITLIPCVYALTLLLYSIIYDKNI